MLRVALSVRTRVGEYTIAPVWKAPAQETGALSLTQVTVLRLTQHGYIGEQAYRSKHNGLATHGTTTQSSSPDCR